MRALILVDIQNDFMPTGALPVPNGHEVVPVANKLMPKFDLVVATQDWHPETHGSFAKHHGKQPGEVIDLNGLQQVLWPHHCVQGTKGAEFVKELDASKIDAVFQKGTDPGIDSYSGFHDNGHRKATGLGDYLRMKGADEVYVLGVATDYCVRFTALDAVREGFKTRLIEDGSRGVNLQPDDSAKAIEEMKAAGVKVMRSAEVS